jgi:F0F1-type ATP synthase membrane subunit b/b'
MAEIPTRTDEEREEGRKELLRDLQDARQTLERQQRDDEDDVERRVVTTHQTG